MKKERMTKKGQGTARLLTWAEETAREHRQANERRDQFHAVGNKEATEIERKISRFYLFLNSYIEAALTTGKSDKDLVAFLRTWLDDLHREADAIQEARIAGDDNKGAADRESQVLIWIWLLSEFLKKADREPEITAIKVKVEEIPDRDQALKDWLKLQGVKATITLYGPNGRSAQAWDTDHGLIRYYGDKELFETYKKGN